MKISTLDGKEIDIDHRQAGTYMSNHVVILKINNEKIVLSEEQVENFSSQLLNGLPTKYDPKGFKRALIGKSFSEFWDFPATKLYKIAKLYSINFEELHDCIQNTVESKKARKGKDELCLWIEHDEKNIITDIFWG